MKNKQSDLVIILYGPTGVGKTDISLALAEQLPVEIINSDVGQFYTPLSIGTAKPAWRTQPIPHHFFDIIDTPRSITVAQWRDMIVKKITEIKNRNKIPVIVGGSGFYVRSLFFPVQVNNDHTPGESNVPEENNNEKSTRELWEKLVAVDPLRAASLEKTDRYRIERALTLYNSSGKSSVELTPVYNPISDYYLINLSREVQELNERINKRVKQMFQEGWMDEAEKLTGTEWETFLRQKKLIGYADIFEYNESLHHKNSFTDLVDIISQKTRQYAKRQRTFWRKLERECAQVSSYTGPYVGCIQTMDLTSKPVHLYISELLQVLSLYGQKDEL